MWTRNNNRRQTAALNFNQRSQHLPPKRHRVDEPSEKRIHRARIAIKKFWVLPHVVVDPKLELFGESTSRQRGFFKCEEMMGRFGFGSGPEDGRCKHCRLF
ncbi:hypothetical protein AVEN_4702-1 [Araneus ventricosus]|uniref:Uncharacterized protein n=1 Tax=Araneus ventricosus TaxID=182803 RepID=A0A4Y2QSW5_ARAVE|nr:hypothetical protein AVEN_4702-1 [Araneus ventricosus]